MGYSSGFTGNLTLCSFTRTVSMIFASIIIKLRWLLNSRGRSIPSC